MVYRHVSFAFACANDLAVGRRKFWPTVLEKAEGIKDAAINPTQASDGKIGVNLYRANILNRVLRPQQRHATIPVQLIVPTGDNFMVQEIWDDLSQWASKLWRREVDSGHWIQVSLHN